MECAPLNNDGKPLRVLVTAAARGIGRAIAKQFVRAGARVHICDIDAQGLAVMEQAMEGLSSSICDVADMEQVRTLFADVEGRLGGLDVLVNNAGIAGPIGPVGELDPLAWERTLAVNLNGQFYCANAAVPLLKRDGGVVINIASTAGLLGCPLRAAYAASKWGVIGLTKTMAMELGPHGVRVNAICPGSVDGERIRSVMTHDARSQGVSMAEMERSYLEQNSMRVLIEPDEVASLVLYLASEQGRKISGQAIALDGNTESFSLRNQQEQQQ